MSTELLDRLSFGARSSDLLALGQDGPRAWVEQQLHPTKADPVVEQELASTVLRISYGEGDGWPALSENRPLTMLSMPPEQLWQIADGQNKVAYEERARPLRELTAARLIRAVHSRWQLRELMVDFWLDHFNVYAGDTQVGAAMIGFEGECIRPNALGNFGQMLESVAQSTAMLVYLNNRTSRTGAPNENYARELFELHTLGRARYMNELYNKWRLVPGADRGEPIGYIDQDVYEAARAFTGWVIEDGRGLGAGQSLPKTGRFTYLESWHDPYQKRVLAQDIDPFAAPLADGKAVLSRLVSHPGTAEHLCEKICRRLISDTPPASVVQSSAKVWRDNLRHPQQIALVIEHIIGTSAFAQSLSQPELRKVRRPLELVAAFVRKLGLPFTPTQSLANEISNAGQRLYLWPTPDGHPDVAGFWLTTHTMRRRWLLPWGLINNWYGTSEIAPQHLSGGLKRPLDEVELLRHHASALLGPKHSGTTLESLSSTLKTPSRRLLGSANDEWSGLRASLAYLAMSPAFQYR